MQSIHASVQEGVQIGDGAGYQNKFNAIWVGTDGDIAISEDHGNTFVTYTNVPGGAFFGVDGNHIGTVGDGTTATGLVAGLWGK